MLVYQRVVFMVKMVIFPKKHVPSPPATQQPIDSPTTSCLPEEQWPVRAPHRWESWKTTSIPRPPGKNTEKRPATGPGDNWTWFFSTFPNYDLSELMENDIEWNNEWYTWNNDIVDDDWWCIVLWIIIWILYHNFSVLQPRIDSSARMWLAPATERLNSSRVKPSFVAQRPKPVEWFQLCGHSPINHSF